MNKRIAYIDVARGMGILLVALGHSISTMSIPINTVILSFHMPLFFFISGMLFYNKPEQKGGDFVNWFKRKFQTLLVPMFFLVVFSAVYNLLYAYLSGDYSLHILKRTMTGVLLFKYEWFLKTLFFMEAILWLCLCVFPKKKLPIILLGITSLVLFFVPFSDTWIVRQLLASLFFGACGYLARPLIDSYDSFNYKGWGGGICVVALLAMCNQPIGMYCNQYGNKALFITTALIGIISIIELSFAFERSGTLIFLGINSITIYITHGFIIRIFKLSFKVMAVNFDVRTEYIVVFLITMLLEIPIVLIVRKYFPFVIGKSRVKQIS